MSTFVSRYLDRLRNPEYTGQNRCVPCTGLNVALSIAVSLFIAYVAVELALIFLVAALAIIYFRGYIIPGTPSLTKRYLPDRLAQFLTHPLEEKTEVGQRWETIEKIEYEKRHAVNPEQFLVDEGVIGRGTKADDLCFTNEFSTLVEHQMEIHRNESMNLGLIADMFDVEIDDIVPLDRDYPAVKISRRIRKWPSEAALVADVVTHEALGMRTDSWGEIPIEQRQRILASLRGFHERCPLCSGEVRYFDDVVESCCAEYEVTRIACVDCDERFLEFDASQIGAEANIKGFTP